MTAFTCKDFLLVLSDNAADYRSTLLMETMIEERPILYAYNAKGIHKKYL